MAQASQSSREEVLAAALDDIELKIAFRRQQKIILHYHAMYYIISPAKKAKNTAAGYRVSGLPRGRAAGVCGLRFAEIQMETCRTLCRAVCRSLPEKRTRS